MATPHKDAYEVLRGALHQYSLALLALVALVVLGVAPPFIASKIAWAGLAWVALALATFLIERREWIRPHWRPTRTHILLILGAAATLALVLRYLPQAHTELAVGYDYGFYKEAMAVYERASPQVPEQDLPDWVALQFEPGLLWLHQVLHEVAGLSAHDHVRTLFPIFSGLLLIPLYAATRAYFGAAAGLGAAGLYAASFTQYTVHEYLYEKNVLALALLLLLFFCLAHRRWIPAAILLGGIGVIHRPTFLLAAVSLATYTAVDFARTREWKGWLIVALGSLPLWLPLWVIRAQHFFAFGFLVIESAADTVGRYQPEGGGTFLSFIEYQNAAVTYLPLALAGSLLLLRRNQAVLPALAFALSFLNVVLHFVFYNRFIIMLDFVSLLLVAATLFHVLAPFKPRTQTLAVGALFLLTLVPTLVEAFRPPAPPYLWMSDEEHDGVEWIRENTPEDATLLASNLHAPYVMADSARRTYGPGLFDDPHNQREWRAFFTTTDPAAIDDFLDTYPEPLYVVHIGNYPSSLGHTKLRPPQFELEYQKENVEVWRYVNETQR